MTDDSRPRTQHLDEIPDGCGCTEVWEYLSQQREVDE